jgi:hypothetical protein
MNHEDLYRLRETYNEKRILLCFNGPFSQGLIEELGQALKNHVQNEETPNSSAFDVFTAYIEVAQNIREYAHTKGYDEKQASATVVISQDPEGRYVISAGNFVEPEDGPQLVERINALTRMDKTELKQLFKKQLREPRGEGQSAGLGLIDLARKASGPFSGFSYPVDAGTRCFFTVRVVI